MKQSIMAFLLYSLSLVVNAQVRMNLPVYCGSTENLLRTLQTQYKEMPTWSAASDDKQSVFALFYNQDTLSWTFVKFNEEIACVLSAGENGVLLRPTPK